MSEEIPVQVQAADTITVTMYNVQTAGRIIITIDGDTRSLLPHVSTVLGDVIAALDET